MNWDRPMIGVPLILVLGAALGIAYNALNRKPIPWIAEARATVALEDLAAPPPEAATPGEAKTTANPADAAVPSGGTNGNADGRAVASSETAKALIASIPESEYPISVDLKKAKEVYDSGAAVVLDAREVESYVEGHLKGALSAPYDAVSADDEWLAKTTASAPLLLVYCDGGECELALDLAFALTQAGHRRVLVMDAGFPGWKEAGYPTATGETP